MNLPYTTCQESKLQTGPFENLFSVHVHVLLQDHPEKKRMVKTLAPPMVKYKQHMKERLNFVIGAEIPLTKQKDVQNTQEKVYAWEGGTVLSTGG